MKSAPACPVTTALAVIGGKWKVIILWQLHGQVKRFGELQKSIPGISQKMLTQELRDLEESGLVGRKVYPVVPPRVEYCLTEYGDSIKPLMDQLCVWGQGFQKRMAAANQEAHRPSDFVCTEVNPGRQLGVGFFFDHERHSIRDEKQFASGS